MWRPDFVGWLLDGVFKGFSDLSGYLASEPPLKRGLNDLDGCLGQLIVIRGGEVFFGVKIDSGTRVVVVLG
jgi:hypothetical protein